MEQELRILMLEDNPVDVELISYALRKGKLDFVSKRVQTEEDFRRELAGFQPDILLLDFELPDFDGLLALTIAKSITPDTPAIFVTGVMGEESAVNMLHQGATDYVLKDNLSRLVPAVERALREVEELAQLKAADEALRASEERYLNIFDNTRSGVAVFEASDDGEDFVFVDFNKAAEGISRISREDVIGRSVLEAFPGVLEDGLFEVFQRVWRTGVPEHRPEHRYSDERITGWRDYYIYRLSSGELVAVYQDITERKEIEESLRESEEKLASAQEAGRFGSWEYDVDSRAIEWSLQTYRLYERDPALGPPTDEEEAGYYSEEQARVLRQFAARAMTDGRAFQYDLEVKLPSGRRAFYWATLRPIKDDSGRVTKLHGTVQDITRRKEAEDALRSSGAFYNALLQNAIDCITVLDESGEITYESPSVTQLLGYTQEELVGRSIFDYVHPEDVPAAMKAFSEGIKVSGHAQLEVRFKHKDGSWRNFWGVGRNLLDDPDIRGIVINSRDVSNKSRPG